MLMDITESFSIAICQSDIMYSYNCKGTNHNFCLRLY